MITINKGDYGVNFNVNVEGLDGEQIDYVEIEVKYPTGSKKTYKDVDVINNSLFVYKVKEENTAITGSHKAKFIVHTKDGKRLSSNEIVEYYVKG